ncbi:hypothetical protein [Fuscibacter oryzae]|uniref:Uncharacterized protein n=1 Tax=Fuscibacter oryzae TaxID=2803939 RepID=A0A8J7MRU6_9RHOB|nr:hypothetical protein [Fuscibacter oryzae]MBL4928477.1 hypothetical protein [Fuscibacter oryzae]
MSFVKPWATVAPGIVLWLAVSGSVMAGGALPVLPVTETLPDFATCLAQLEGYAREDQAQVMARQTDATGLIREVTLETVGVVSTAAAKARYEATLWFHAGRPDAALKQVETSHSYQSRSHTCDGGTLTTEGTDGYTLSTFDPLP